MSAGVFAVARDIWDHPDFKSDEPFSKREAWLWLISSAVWRRGSVGRVRLQRGEFSFSVRFLERKWHWKRGRAERYLNSLKNRDMIRDTSRDGVKIYFIRNYNEFQRVGMPKHDSDRDTSRDTTATDPRQTRDKEKEGNRKKERDSSLRSESPAHTREDEPTLFQESEKPKARAKARANAPRPPPPKKNPEADLEFQEFYIAFPLHKGRLDAAKAYPKAREKISAAELLTAAKAYALEREGENPKFTFRPATWLSGEHWNDEANDERPQKHRRNSRASNAFFDACVDGIHEGRERRTDQGPPRGTVTVLSPTGRESRTGENQGAHVLRRS